MPIYESKLVNLNQGLKMNFNAGDTVQLKSGGEIMTIEEIDEIGQLVFGLIIKKSKDILFY